LQLQKAVIVTIVLHVQKCLLSIFDAWTQVVGLEFVRWRNPSPTVSSFFSNRGSGAAKCIAVCLSLRHKQATQMSLLVGKSVELHCSYGLCRQLSGRRTVTHKYVVRGGQVLCRRRTKFRTVGRCHQQRMAGCGGVAVHPIFQRLCHVWETNPSSGRLLTWVCFYRISDLSR